ncbi:universal stress protein [Algibacter amylolyticus]|uniref:Universal stress protein n=1 Tax=Algibacter amylolyticus TaxID=1608400 RepID=A0A5M7BIP1_9FLAO|nr:universal stress protein [Algibacter amylolyticus]KAA5827534.1 universal stress protein [Algibacter amylolyticus]MBB5266737.1 nucleotide-binding universal stress UspA family protein [Algibacter amylolyticus]TSJ81779.1 universal stress protein [Algibacter amylolyticus]
MKNILVPVGSSKNAVSHLQYAVDFAEAFNAKLFIVQVYNVYTKAGTMIRVDDIIQRESKMFLDDLVSKIDPKNVEIVVKTLKGKLVDTLELACKAADIDLVLIEPRTNSIKDEVYLGKTSGKIVKQMDVPALIIPEGYKFSPVKTILMAVKSAIIKKENALNPLLDVKKKFDATLNLLLVKTPFYNEGDFEVKEELSTIVDQVTKSGNATTFQGVLEHFQSNNPDMLCVVRRKRGFFVKKWEKSTILKKDFFSKVPVLVLSGLK